MRVNRHPNWCKSATGQNIELVHSGHFVFKKGLSPVIVIGGVHGDEPEGVTLASELLNWLIQSNESEDQIQPWAVIPCLNIDGFKLNQRTNGNGVDLNRNYPSSNWSPDYKESRYFPGPKAGSEPETLAVVDLIQQTVPRLVIHCHSWKPMIVLTGPPALRDAEALSQASGYPIENTIGYPTPGSLSHYGWVDNKLPIICVEEAERVPSAEIWPRFAEGFKKILRRS